MSVKPSSLEVEKFMKRIREMKAELPIKTEAPPAEPVVEPKAEPVAPPAAPEPVAKPKKEPNAWAKQVKRYQELEKARGRNISLKEAMKELSAFKKEMA